MESGREQNYWPGFVDALSNVVLTLVFVLVIFVFALVMASNKVEKKMQEVVQAQQAKKGEETKFDQAQVVSSQQVQELQQQLQQAQTEIEKLKAENVQAAMSVTASALANTTAQHQQEENFQTVVEAKAAQKVNPEESKIRKDTDSIVINYPQSVVEVDEKSTASLKDTLDIMKSKCPSCKIFIHAMTGSEPYSAAQRLAYYRVLGMRNYLINKGYAQSGDITSSITQPDKPGSGSVEIVFQRH